MNIKRTQDGAIEIDQNGYTIRCAEDKEFGGYVCTVLSIDPMCGRGATEEDAIKKCLMLAVPLYAGASAAFSHMLVNRRLDIESVEVEDILADILAVI